LRTSKTRELGAAPGRALWAVFERDSRSQQFVADFVGAAKVFRATRFVAFGDQRSDLRF